MEKANPVNTKMCRFLRAKNMYGGLEGGGNPWYMLDDANTFCWCIRSSGAAGPDNGLVSPSACIRGRACFEEPK